MTFNGLDISNSNHNHPQPLRLGLAHGYLFDSMPSKGDANYEGNSNIDGYDVHGQSIPGYRSLNPSCTSWAASASHDGGDWTVLGTHPNASSLALPPVPPIPSGRSQDFSGQVGTAVAAAPNSSMDIAIDINMFLQQYGPFLSSPLPLTTSPKNIDYFSFGKDNHDVGVIDFGSFSRSPGNELVPPPPVSLQGDQVNNQSGPGPEDFSSKTSATSSVTLTSANNPYKRPDNTSDQGQIAPKNGVGSKPSFNHNDDCNHNHTQYLGPPATLTAFDSLQDFPFPYQPTPLEPVIERFLNSYFPKNTFSNEFGLSNSHINGKDDGSSVGATHGFNSGLDSNSGPNPTPGLEDYLDIPDDTPGMIDAHSMNAGGLEKKEMAQGWAHVNGNGSGQSQGDGFGEVSLLSASSGSEPAARLDIPTDFFCRVLSFSWEDLGHFCNELESQ